MVVPIDDSLVGSLYGDLKSSLSLLLFEKGILVYSSSRGCAKSVVGSPVVRNIKID